MIRYLEAKTNSNSHLYRHNSLNNENIILKGYEQDKFWDWVLAAALVILGIKVLAKDCYSAPQQINRQNNRNETRREEEIPSNLESSLEKDELTKEDKDTLLSTITAKLMYNPDKSTREKIEKKDYSTADYSEELEKLEAEIRENYVNSKAEENYEVAAVGKETEGFDENPDNNESARVNSEEPAESAQEKNTADADSE